jgi:hypothetical protein
MMLSNAGILCPNEIFPRAISFACNSHCARDFFCRFQFLHGTQSRKITLLKKEKRRFQEERHQRLRNTQITLSAFSFAAVNYQLSIVSTHFVQRQQTSAYGMISYTFVGLSSIFRVAKALPKAFLLFKQHVRFCCAIT